MPESSVLNSTESDKGSVSLTPRKNRQQKYIQHKGEMRPLLDKDSNKSLEIGSLSANSKHGRSLISKRVDDADTPSINYKGYSTDSISSSNSKNQIYVPTAMEDLSWTEILPYYIPCISWMRHYNTEFFIGDLIGGFTLVCFQLPLSLSYATSLAKVPVVCGLYSLGISPLMYMIFGSVPQMVVGPEGPISLIVGQAVEPYLHHNKRKDIDPIECVVAMTFVSGLSLLTFGLVRFGFLDNVLNGSLLKGFISSVGLVMVINSSIEMCGLGRLLSDVIEDPADRDIHSPFDKLTFLIQNLNKIHPFIFKVSVSGFCAILILKTVKKIAAKKLSQYSKTFALFPEILAVLIAWTVMSYNFNWQDHEIDLIGSIRTHGSFLTYNPVSLKGFPLIKDLLSAGFSCAMLGFFESATAAKSLGSSFDLPISTNRELVALGSINVVGSFFGCLPAFGGYGRSKVNAIAAKSTLSGAIMGVCAIFATFHLTGFFYYVPKCLLNVIICTIGISLLQEAPHELYFHWKARGYDEIITFLITVVFTLFLSMETGIAVGIVYSLIRVIKNSTESRIQILGRYPGTNTFGETDVYISKLQRDSISGTPKKTSHKWKVPRAFRKLENRKLKFFQDEKLTCLNTDVLEQIEGCIVVKILEPLSFTNTSDLTARLKRIEVYGSTRAHPASRPLRSKSQTHHLIFDLDGMSDLDSSAAEILYGLLKNYRQRNVHVFFVRVSPSLAMRKRLERTSIRELVRESLEDMNYYNDRSKGSNLNIMRTESSALEDELVDYISEDGNLDHLTESEESPYFSHISDALKVIDSYELNCSEGFFSDRHTNDSLV